MITPDFWRGRRVLVTGHTGFKGSWLVLWLLTLGADVWGYALAPEQGNSLFVDLALDQNPGYPNWGKLNHTEGNICDLADLRRYVQIAQPECVVHLAAQPLVRRSYINPLETWSTNVQGSLNLLESLKTLKHQCAVVMVTTDKVYANREWDFGYRENDRLGGHDPYSASKAAAELAIESWRVSFCGEGTHQTPKVNIATARAGNVIGGGDWSEDRIVPDMMRCLAANEAISVRNPNATRPWQHVLGPLGGYLVLAEKLYDTHGVGNPFASSFNFGPALDSNRSVSELVETSLKHWPGNWNNQSENSHLHEAGRLHLQIDKAKHQLSWQPKWSFPTTVERTVAWYQAVHKGASPLSCCLSDLEAYEGAFN